MPEWTPYFSLEKHSVHSGIFLQKWAIIICYGLSCFCRDIFDFKQNWHCALLWKRCAGVCGRSLCQFALLNQLKPNVIDMDFSLSNWLLRPPKQLLPSTISLSIQWQIEQKNKNVLVSFPEFFVMTKASVVNFEMSSVWPGLWDLGQILLKRNS